MCFKYATNRYKIGMKQLKQATNRYQTGKTKAANTNHTGVFGVFFYF